MATAPISKQGWLGLNYLWTVASLGFLLSLSQASALNSVLSVFVKPMSEELGWTRAAISGVATSGAIASGLLGLVVGPLLDRRGLRLLAFLGLLVLGGSLAALSQVGELWSFYALHSLARVSAMGIIGVVVTVVVSNWFVKRRGRAMGLAFLGNRVGGAVLPVLALYFVENQGWRSGWFNLGLLVSVLAIPALVYLRRRPEDIGLTPDGGVAPAQAALAAPSNGTRELGLEPSWTLRSAARTPALWLLAVASSQAYLVYGSLNLHQVPFMTDVGISSALAVGTLTAMALSAGGGGLLWGMLAEKVHVRYALASAFVLAAFGMVLLLSVSSATMAYAYAIVAGIAIGGTISLSGIVWAEYFGRGAVGAIQGLVLPLQMFANAFGPFIAGWAFDVTGRYREVFSLFAAAFVLAAICTLLARTPRLPPAESYPKT